MQIITKFIHCTNHQTAPTTLQYTNVSGCNRHNNCRHPLNPVAKRHIVSVQFLNRIRQSCHVDGLRLRSGTPVRLKLTDLNHQQPLCNMPHAAISLNTSTYSKKLALAKPNTSVCWKHVTINTRRPNVHIKYTGNRRKPYDNLTRDYTVLKSTNNYSCRR